MFQVILDVVYAQWLQSEEMMNFMTGPKNWNDFQL